MRTGACSVGRALHHPGFQRQQTQWIASVQRQTLYLIFCHDVANGCVGSFNALIGGLDLHYLRAAANCQSRVHHKRLSHRQYIVLTGEGPKAFVGNRDRVFPGSQGRNRKASSATSLSLVADPGTFIGYFHRSSGNDGPGLIRDGSFNA